MTFKNSPSLRYAGAAIVLTFLSGLPHRAECELYFGRSCHVKSAISALLHSEAVARTELRPSGKDMGSPWSGAVALGTTNKEGGSAGAERSPLLGEGRWS